MTPAVFIDRDGTLIQEVGYLSRREDIRYFPWSVDAIRLLKRAGYLVFIATNQGGIGLGYYPEQFVRETHALMHETLARAGAVVDGWLFCPHHPRGITAEASAPCTCRKPGRGMADQAAASFAIDFARSWAIGDRRTDVEFGRGFGGRGILVRTGYGAGEDARLAGQLQGAAHVADDLMGATSWILRAG